MPVSGEVNLKAEIGLNRGFESPDEELLLSFVTAFQRLTRLGYGFFGRYGLTDAQFNVLMLLHDYRETGLRQFELADLLLVNRASAGALVNRMEKKGWLRRTPDPDDRRSNIVRIAPAGAKLLEKVKGPYYRLVSELFAGFKSGEKRQFSDFLDRFRRQIRRLESEQTG